MVQSLYRKSAAVGIVIIFVLSGCTTISSPKKTGLTCDYYGNISDNRKDYIENKKLNTYYYNAFEPREKSIFDSSMTELTVINESLSSRLIVNNSNNITRFYLIKTNKRYVCHVSDHGVE